MLVANKEFNKGLGWDSSCNNKYTVCIYIIYYIVIVLLMFLIATLYLPMNFNCRSSCLSLQHPKVYTFYEGGKNHQTNLEGTSPQGDPGKCFKGIMQRPQLLRV